MSKSIVSLFLMVSVFFSLFGAGGLIAENKNDDTQVPNAAALVASAEGKRPRIEVPLTKQSLLELGQERLDDYGSYLAQLEYYYGVDPEVILGIWGIESRYGQNVGKLAIGPALRRLAAREPWRRKFAQQQLASAARLVKNGLVDHRDLVGSWAGALGQTQFIPTSYERFGVDGDFNGTIDLWTAHDALASTANYLRQHGWIKGQPWGQAVEVPKGFYDKKANRERHGIDYWKGQGVQLKYAGDFPQKGFARVERYQGADYILYDNFFNIMKYNASRDYAFSVSALGDQVMHPDRAGVREIGEKINAGANIRSNGPGGGKTGGCRNRKVCGLQAMLKRNGYYKGAIDGVYGPQTKRALGQYLLSKRK